MQDAKLDHQFEGPLIMRKSVIICLCCIALASCATDQQGVRVETINVPTPVRCVDPAKVPAEPPQVSDQLNGDAEHDIGVIAPSALLLRKWGESMIALIVPACTVVNPAPPAP